MSTSVEGLERSMRAPREDEHLEFKEAKSQYDEKDIYRYCVALANEGGGQLILGVSDKVPRRVVGTDVFPETQRIADKIYNKLHFRVDVEEVHHADGRVLLFHIPSRPLGTAYHHEGAYLMRSTESLVPMSEDRLRQIFGEGRPPWAEQVALAGCSGSDIVRLLDTQSYFDLLNLPYPSKREAVLEKFAAKGFIVRSGAAWNITNLGAILFAKTLSEFSSLGRKAARVVVYKGTGKLHTRLDTATGESPFDWGYAVAFDSLLTFINSQVPQNEVIGKALRVEAQMFPIIAIREMVANAIIHQDFEEHGGSVMVEIYDDRMEISNLGKPIIPPERFIDEHQSRNEQLAEVMRHLGICEEKGSGVDKTIAAIEEYQLPAPDFRVGEKRTLVVLFGHKPFPTMERAERVRACYQHCCLQHQLNKDMTNQSLRERFGLPNTRAKIATVSQVIADTIEAGLIKPTEDGTGSRRYARYLPSWG